MIKDPSTSQEPPCPPKLQQNVIILQEGSCNGQGLGQDSSQGSGQGLAILDLHLKSETKS